jgi:hypothetical protein
MTAVYVERESDQTVARFVALTAKDTNDAQCVVGSDYGLPILDINHLRMHEGRAFNAYKYYPPNAGLAAGASLNMVFTTNVGTSAHVTIQTSCSQDCEIAWFEGASASGGTIFTPINRNRESTRISQAGILVNPTVTATGTEFHREYISAGNSKKAAGSGAFSLEYIFQDNVSYMIRMTNVGNGSATAYLSLDWYE